MTATCDALTANFKGTTGNGPRENFPLNGNKPGVSCNVMNPVDLIPTLLLLLLAAALGGGAMLVGLIAIWRHAEAKSLNLDEQADAFAPVSPLRAY